MAAHPANAAGPINPSNPCEYQLYQVLERANLLGYFNNFIQQGGDDVSQLCEAPDDEFTDILAMVGMANKPLHIRRLQKSLQEWAKENNVPFLQTAVPCTTTTQAPMNSMPYASALVGLQPPQQTHNMPMGAQWGPGHQSMANQWNSGQPLTSEHSSPNDSPRQSSPYSQPGMSHPQSQAAHDSSSSSSSKTLTSTSAKYTDLRTLRHVAQRIMASHTPTPLHQTSQNKKLLNNVQHIIDMSPDHPQRMEEIQKWAPIYGRFDSKRKDDKPLTAHEITVNEAAILICCMDPYLLVQRDKLFPVARQVVRESGYQFKHGHSRSVKLASGRSDDSAGSKPKRLRGEAGAGSYQHSEVATPNPRTVQAEILKLRREERMNEILLNLNSIVQKQSDIKASIAAARSEDNIQQVYDLKVQLEKLTTQQLLLMTEQTDLIKRQRRSDRYYVAKARAETENADLDDMSNPEAEDGSKVSDPEEGNHSGNFLQAPTSVEPASPAIEGARTPPDKQQAKKPANSSLAQTLLMQHTLMNEGLRVAQNYALDTRGRSASVPAPAPSGRSARELGEEEGGSCQLDSSREEAASLAAESTITALLSLSSSSNNQREGVNPQMDL